MGRVTAGLLAGLAAAPPAVLGAVIEARTTGDVHWEVFAGMFLALTGGLLWLGERRGLIEDPYRRSVIVEDDDGVSQPSSGGGLPRLDLIRSLVERRAGARPRAASQAELEPLGEAIQRPELRDYFRSCLPSQDYLASGVHVLDLQTILDEVALGAAPGGAIFPFGYVPIASSIGGNLVCLHPDGVFWADHTGWYEDTISYQDRENDTWVQLDGYSPAHVRRALHQLSPDVEGFLVRLLRDQLTAELDALD